MSAQPSTSPSTPDPVADFLRPYYDDYLSHLQVAREGAEMTASPGWRHNWEVRQAEDAQARDRYAKILQANADQSRRTPTTEEDEKAVKDAVKTIAEQREMMTSFITGSLGHFATAVSKCAKVIQAAEADAEAEMRHNPLRWSGLGIDLVSHAKAGMKAWQRCNYEPAEGRIYIER
jgi:hypothetical protein